VTPKADEVGRQLRELRRAEGLTLTSVAYALDIEPARLEALEEGRTPLIARELWAFQNRFGLDEDELLELSDLA
jgi:transcriptional regulator with XRE-family HTH domain